MQNLRNKSLKNLSPDKIEAILIDQELNRRLNKLVVDLKAKTYFKIKKNYLIFFNI